MGNQPDSYIGRFAPSPSGPLHFGSLVAALASYLDARANNGKWLVRIEDIDPPREPTGTAHLILKTLEAYGLHWDDSVLYQSTRSQCYDDVLEHLLTTEELYPCICTRKQLSGLNGVYPGYCRDNRNVPNQPHALRLRCHDQVIHFTDRIQGRYSFDLNELGDFTLKRKDGLYAYQLAVSVDDHFQRVTHIVRGVDLLDSTPRQIHLQNQLGYPNPMYAHIPVIVESDGNKLSKQNHAPAIPQDEPRPLMIKAFSALGMQADNQLEASTIEEILQWGIENWSPTALLQKSKILQTSIQ